MHTPDNNNVLQRRRGGGGAVCTLLYAVRYERMLAWAGLGWLCEWMSVCASAMRKGTSVEARPGKNNEAAPE